MKGIRKGISIISAAAILANMNVSTVLGMEVSTVSEEVVGVSEQQSNAINMLNYICELTYEASISKNRIRLEELYSALTNNTRPNAVDSQTLDEVMSLLDTLEGYRMTDVKRERVQYLYEQSIAQAFREAMPSPIGLLSLTRSYSNPKKLLSVIYMAVDSTNNYQAAIEAADTEKLMQNWELDDEESSILNKSRKDLFAYMVAMVTNYGLDDSLSLNEESIEDFVKWKDNDSSLRKIQFFESKVDTYKAFGPYWLALADCYFENGNYDKCIQALEAYEELDIRIFRMDYELAKTLPKIIMAANEVLSEKEYIDFAGKYGQVILDNTRDAQWDLKYFVAETFVDLYNRTGEKEYLQRAYDIAINNANYLLDQQVDMNKKYLSKIEKVKYPDGATKNQKKDVDEYNKYLKEERKKELPPASEPLLLNIDLLYSLAKELDIPDTEKARIDALLSDPNGMLFLSVPISKLYTFEEKSTEKMDAVEFVKDEVRIPVKFVTSTTTIEVNVKGEENAVFEDWFLDEVDRGEENDINTFMAVFKSEEAEKYNYLGDETVSVSITPMDGTDMKTEVFEFQAKREKALDILNEFQWLDDASKWTDSIEFERVDEK